VLLVTTIYTQEQFPQQRSWIYLLKSSPVF
jgi:hypothetical protein